jgi:hypothetical protein
MRSANVLVEDRAAGAQSLLQLQAGRVVHLMQESFFFVPVALCGAQEGGLVRSQRGVTCARCRRLARQRVAEHISPLVVSLG